MKYLLVFILFIQTVPGYSQFFVGDSKEFTKNMLLDAEKKITESKLTDSTSSISWVVEGRCRDMLVFDRHGIAIKEIITPENDEAVKYFVNWFNKDFATFSATEWRDYTTDKIYKILLSYLTGKAVFTITLGAPGK